MEVTLAVLVTVALVGAGVITGLLFAFSNFVLAALAQLPNEHGMSAMQRINEKILNPVFMVFFFGTPFACIGIIFLSGHASSGQPFLVAGAMLYLVGPLGVTVLFNVPLNNRLAAEGAERSDSVWPAYRNKWQYWNHIRTYCGLGSICLLGSGAVCL